MKHKNQKNKLIRIWEILRQDTDRTNTVSTNELVRRLGEEGIAVERKTIYEDIRLLQTMGYPVYVRRSRVNEYYAEDSSFSVAELRLLIDSVQSATFLSSRLSKELTNKVAALAGSGRAETLRGVTTFLSGDHRPDDEVLATVGLIQQAIAARRKVGFRYFFMNVDKQRVYRERSSGGQEYRFSPYSLVYKDNNYYLVGILDEQDKYLTFRVDRMCDLVILPEARYLPLWAKTHLAADYIKETFSMFAGDSVRATFLCQNTAGVIDIVLERFGYSTALTAIDDEHFYFAANVQLSPQFFSWLVGLDGKVILYSPREALDEYCRYLQAQLTRVGALNHNE